MWSSGPLRWHMSILIPRTDRNNNLRDTQKVFHKLICNGLLYLSFCIDIDFWHQERMWILIHHHFFIVHSFLA